MGVTYVDFFVCYEGLCGLFGLMWSTHEEIPDYVDFLGLMWTFLDLTFI